ncbi:response regulator transcription factor [Clostridium saccharoperbutylacetonicum]|uniref:response regulator transcription factor n=1 Tax=Clostridium saccharoperbutylacetonicum TaxID=36745 RepID=UPI000983E3E6|nr:response regulator transcription factor [Clostridium saccharoperbutylacetonicum]AQR94594.1 transcriptional regulatory protein SrrA [Clostridium saccharoperbutylacetonicum]NSB30431.1 DNA-binding response OmpR family regulator [Clostridium saccharoperbutylacetonicum]
MPNKILVVDGDSEIRNIAGTYLENEGFEVLKAENGEQALEIIYKNEFDLVLIETMMFGMMNWIETCMKIKQNKIMPIIFLSKKSEGLDKFQDMPSIADDYIGKPFSSKELIDVVKSKLHRYTMYSDIKNLAKNKIKVGNLTINSDIRQVFIGNDQVKLTPKEFDILELLAGNKGIIFSIEKIYERVWGDMLYKSDNTVMVHIRKIRKKIEKEPKNPIYIKTVWGVGYKI